MNAEKDTGVWDTPRGRPALTVTYLNNVEIDACCSGTKSMRTITLNRLKLVARRLPPAWQLPLRRVARYISNRKYADWVRDFDTRSDNDIAAIRAHIADLSVRPLISVIMPCYNPPQWALVEAIASVRSQLYQNWELCIADDASPGEYVPKLLTEFAKADPRIKWVRRKQNGRISAASNSALALAQGEYVALMDHDDILPENALYEVVDAINNSPNLDIIYSDEDQIDRHGRRHSPYFKTGWNIDLLRGHNMVSHLGVYRRSLIDQVGGFKEGLEGSQDYDLALRCADATAPHRIHHISSILYHWRRDYGVASFSERNLIRCRDAAISAIQDHLVRCEDSGKVEPHPAIPYWTRVRRTLTAPAPKVSIIVPTRDRVDLLARCLRGVLHQTDYPDIELLIVDNQSRMPETHRFLTSLMSDPRIRILSFNDDFNYSAMNNMAADEATGSILALLNNDIEIIHPDWLSQMVSLSLSPGVGIVGAKLLYLDGRVQHGGLALGLDGIANPLNHGLRRDELGYSGRNVMASSVSAVTAACMVVHAHIYSDVGGFDASKLAVAFNDVDFCLKVREKGYRVVWTPDAELYHHESASRGTDESPERSARLAKEADIMNVRWKAQLNRDPFYNENFAVNAGNSFQLASPPRKTNPWSAYLK